MSALDWIADKAKPLPIDYIDIDENDEGIEPGRYRVETRVFEGYLPRRMMAELKRNRRPLVNDDFTHETLQTGTGYVSGQNFCRYSITKYVPA